jgi:hypothetical protein
MSPQPKYRRQLNTSQQSILEALYKFRFGTVKLLAKYTNDTTVRYTQERLRILHEQGFIGRRYDKSYHLLNKPSTYYLLPNGIERLAQNPELFKASVLRNIRNDTKASQRFIDHCLNIFNVWAELQDTYEDTFSFKTRSDTRELAHFPVPQPDGYVLFKSKSGKLPKHYILECFDTTKPQTVMRQRLVELVEHASSGAWPKPSLYPDLLIVCPDWLIPRAKTWAEHAIAEGWVHDLEILVTTKAHLMALR